MKTRYDNSCKSCDFFFILSSLLKAGASMPRLSFYAKQAPSGGRGPVSYSVPVKPYIRASCLNRGRDCSTRLVGTQ